MEYILTEKYYDGDTLVEEVITKEVNEDYEDEAVKKSIGEISKLHGIDYVLQETKLTVDGAGKNLPYLIKERDLKIEIEKIYKK